MRLGPHLNTWCLPPGPFGHNFCNCGLSCALGSTKGVCAAQICPVQNRPFFPTAGARRTQVSDLSWVTPESQLKQLSAYQHKPELGIDNWEDVGNNEEGNKTTIRRQLLQTSWCVPSYSSSLLIKKLGSAWVQLALQTCIASIAQFSVAALYFSTHRGTLAFI